MVSDGLRKLSIGFVKESYCLGKVSVGARKVSGGPRKMSDGLGKVSDGLRYGAGGLRKLFKSYNHAKWVIGIANVWSPA